MAELWDAYDKKFNKIENTTLVRGETIPDGIYHLVSEVIVKHTDGSYLLMQRDLRKHHGGEWEVTAGGSALQGENGLEAAIRELKEETGDVYKRQLPYSHSLSIKSVARNGYGYIRTMQRWNSCGL